MKLRTSVIGILGVIGFLTALGGLFAPTSILSDDELGVTTLSNLRAYSGAGVVMALFALYSLSRKQFQETALIMLMISLGGWNIGQTISYFADVKPDTFTIGSIVVQALLIPIVWKALKSK
jgi:hypothetical protein